MVFKGVEYMELQQHQRLKGNGAFCCRCKLFYLHLYQINDMKILEFKNKGIYIIINVINNECYIGHSTNLGNRLTKHFSLLRNNKHDNYRLQKDFNQFGESNFKFGILEYIEKDFLKKEQDYVNKYKPKYNITKDIIRNTPSIESRIKMSKTRKELYKKGILKPKGSKPIIQTNLDGNFIAEYPSIMEAVRKTGLDRSGIQRVLYGKYKQMKGFIFSYK